LDAFLHSITYLPIKNINKHFSGILGNTDDVKFSLNNFLDSDSITNYLKSYVSSSKNGMILDITFKFIIGSNMWLIYAYLYAPRKKRRLSPYIKLFMCGPVTFYYNIETFYIDLYFFFYISFFFFFSFFLNRNFFLLLRNFVIFCLYVGIYWKIWKFFLTLYCY
jgi:hypothetical protein